MKKRHDVYDFAFGIILILFFDIILWLISYSLLDYVFSKFIYMVVFYNTLYFGVLQYIYILPLIFWHFLKQNRKIAYGMIIGSLFALLINILFWILLINSMPYYGF